LKWWKKWNAIKIYTWLGLHPDAKLTQIRDHNSFHGQKHKWIPSKPTTRQILDLKDKHKY
jgi:hypothetical protein